MNKEILPMVLHTSNELKSSRVKFLHRYHL